jgi:hypothetical protein
MPWRFPGSAAARMIRQRERRNRLDHSLNEQNHASNVRKMVGQATEWVSSTS